MDIELTAATEAQLRALAARTGRNVQVLVDEAVRQYVESLAITDLEPEHVAETQTSLIPELRKVPDWKASDA